MAQISFFVPAYDALDKKVKTFSEEQILQNRFYYDYDGVKRAHFQTSSAIFLAKDGNFVFDFYNVLGSFTKENTCEYKVIFNPHTMDYKIKNCMGYGGLTWLTELPENKRKTRTRSELNEEQQKEMDCMIAASLLLACYEYGELIEEEHCNVIKDTRYSKDFF